MIVLYVVGKTVVEQDAVIWLRRNTGVIFIEAGVAQLCSQASVSWVVFVCVFVNHVSQTNQLLLILG